MATKTEREYVEDARDAIRKAEHEWDKAIDAVMGVVRFNAEAGNANLSNEAFGVAAAFAYVKAEMMAVHKAQTDVLLANWPDFGADVTTQGPGR